MSYSDLQRLGVTFRPIDAWPGPLNPDRRWAPFKATLGSTVGLLERELRMLDAKLIVLQVAMTDRDIRLDGFPRANARASHPGVVLAFESKWGPLKYATDEFTEWQDNLRAIALSMEALRKVDRYGVSKRGEQYQGWKAIPASTDPADAIQTREQAAEYLSQWAGDVRRAVRETHPDTNPDVDPAEFRKVMRAKELLA